MQNPFTEAIAKTALFLTFLVAVAMLVAVGAGASTWDSVEQFEPTYFIIQHSDGDWMKNDEAPNVKAQASFAMPVDTVRSLFGVEFQPMIAFTWTANDWPIGAPSSPIVGQEYTPRGFIQLHPNDDTGLYRGSRFGYLHRSTGTDSASGSWDRMEGEVKIAPIDGLTIYVRGWWAFKYGAETEPIKYFANFAALEDFGGEVLGVITLDTVRLATTLGLSWQQVELFLPVKLLYNFTVYGQLHNGNVASLNRYATREVSGGFGVAKAMSW